MEVSSELLKAIIVEYYGDGFNEDDDEWIIPSFEKPWKQKCYVNVEKCTAIDFIGGKGYNSFQLVSAITGIGDYNQLNKWILDFAIKKLKSPISLLHKSQPIKPKLPPLVQKIPLPEECIDIDKSTLAMNYLRKRKIGPALWHKYHLKFCQNGKYAGRIIIPFVEHNEVVWFQARSIFKHMSRYDNPKGVKRNMIVYNIDAIDKVSIIVEGPFDAQMVNGQAIMGSKLSDWQILKILNRNPEKIILVPDSDYQKSLGKSVGYEGCLHNILSLVEAGFPLKNISIAFVEGGKDLNEIGPQKSIEMISNSKPVNLSTLVKFKQEGNVQLEKLLKII